MYEKIYEYWRRERTEPNLQSIDKGFYEELADYIRKLKEYAEKADEKTARKKLTEEELKRAQEFSKELLETRLQKILRIAEMRSGQERASKTVVGEENVILEATFEASRQYQSMIQRILVEDVGQASPRAIPTKSKTAVVRFLVEIPAIIGADLKPYGPFKPEDIATLPLENAEILMKGKAAIKIGCE